MTDTIKVALHRLLARDPLHEREAVTAALDELDALRAKSEMLQESNAALKQNRATIRGVVERAERAEEKNRRLMEFWEAWWAVETGVNDFDLHTQAVMRLERAEAAVREVLGLPAAMKARRALDA